MSGAIGFDTNNWDTASYHSTTINNSRFTAPVNGYYSIGACLYLVPTSMTPTAYVQASFFVNGSLYIDSELATSNIGAGGVAGCVILDLATEWKLSAGDYVELIPTSPGGFTVSSSGVPSFTPSMWMSLIGQ